MLVPGNTLSLTVTATGDAITCQWYKNGKVIPGATNSNLTLNNVQPGNSGSYSMTVSNLLGSATSHNAAVTVLAPPSLRAGRATRIWVPAATGPLRWDAAIPAAPTLGYSETRYSRHVQIVARSATQRLTTWGLHVDLEQRGRIATNTVSLSVYDRPAILAQPAGVTVLGRADVNLVVEACGSSFTYQWLKNGKAMAGATSSNLAINNLTASYSGNYTVIITNPLAKVTSQKAVLTVIPSRP